MKTQYLLLPLICLVLSCIRMPQQYNIISPGIWRASLVLNDSREVIVTRSIDKVVTRDANPESTKTLIPFNFEVIYRNDSSFYIEVINGTERIRFDSIEYGRNIKTGNDTMVIYLTPYASVIRCIYENNKMAGEFIILDKVNYSIPFEASYGQSYRFVKIPEKSNLQINGSWNAIFAKDSSDQFNAIGEFQQNGQKVTGTFRTETGDFRYLSGEISGDKLMLSTFDGAHAFLFKADISDTLMTGVYYSGKHYQCSWEARRSDHDPLIHADSMSRVISILPLALNLQNSEGRWVSLNDPAYMNKPKIIQITGSWCPNCRDESEFLRDFIKDNPDEDLSFLAVAFERGHNRERSLARLAEYKRAMKIPYEVVLGGTANRDTASALFPQIDGIKAYPTMLFVDRFNHIIHVHTGFDGPATSRFNSFREYFHKSVEELKKIK
ncbi:MAG: TlpA family protein disulfide reductase [Saprospiraceae bacterium]|nr:TlpA family protein disulfide reductase [Saprospiraceae bacterium]HMX89528.1 TlpA disulfide reductase family protein [Saprospiraceae bacterium]HMZ40885.1 TlpA disulfide reductase family protein [Saprospiraceae bacterium]HNA64017.1 TlpA disulfide reductase family protein [Saprospiraceae bacterium]HNB31739.1 TlpA disulfide reductase family protein [Saprospiraceae bacterium]